MAKQVQEFSREAIHTGISNLSVDAKWSDVRDFRFANNRTNIVPPLVSVYKEPGQFHTLLSGPNNSHYLIGSKCSYQVRDFSGDLGLAPLWELTHKFNGNKRARDSWEYQLFVQGRYTGSTPKQVTATLLFSEEELAEFEASKEYTNFGCVSYPEQKLDLDCEISGPGGTGADFDGKDHVDKIDPPEYPEPLVDRVPDGCDSNVTLYHIEVLGASTPNPQSFGLVIMTGSLDSGLFTGTYEGDLVTLSWNGAFWDITKGLTTWGFDTYSTGSLVRCDALGLYEPDVIGHNLLVTLPCNNNQTSVTASYTDETGTYNVVLTGSIHSGEFAGPYPVTLQPVYLQWDNNFNSWELNYNAFGWQSTSTDRCDPTGEYEGTWTATF